jgi:UDP-glucose 4-epimerase
MARSHEGDRYYRVPADGRDLNYNIYFSQGEELISQANDYTSHNTQLLDVEGVKQVLLKLDYIRDQLRM